MATWTSLGSTTLLDGAGTNLGSVRFEYDSSSTSGSTWPFRLRIIARSGYTFQVDFRNIVVGGTSYGSKGGLTQNSGVFVTGNVSPGSRSATWTCPWYNGSRSYSITGTLPSKATSPVVSLSNTVQTWQSISADIAITSWGGGASKSFELKITNQPYIAGVAALQEAVNDRDSATVTVTNNSTHYTGGINTVPTILGCGHYYLGVYATNGIAETRYQAGNTYTQPAPGVLTYSRVNGTNGWALNYKAVPANNSSSYTQSELKWNARYRIDGGDWVYFAQNTNHTIDYANCSVTATIPPQSTAEVEAWLTYRGLQSDVSTASITNPDIPVHLYGSVGGQAKEIKHLYGSVNGQTKKIRKLYGSVNGQAKLIFEDS